MKKLKKLLIILIGMFPLICNAEIEKEVKYRWYTFVEDNVRYEEVENNCEYFDESNYKYGDWVYSFYKPEMKKDRIILEEAKEIQLNKEYLNIIKITWFETDNHNLEMYEIELYDKENNKIDFTLSSYILGGNPSSLTDNNLDTKATVYPDSTFSLFLDNTYNVDDIKMKFIYKDEEMDFRGVNFETWLTNEIKISPYSNVSSDIITHCDNGICEREISPNRKEWIEDDFKFNTKIFKYQDKYVKCYNLKKLYVPGYYEELDGFIKDENDYIEITTEKEEVIIKDSNNITTKEKSNHANEDAEIEKDAIISDEKEEETENTEENIDFSNIELYKPIAMVTKENQKEKSKSILPYIIFIIVLISLTLITYIARKVIKCRTK